MPRSAHRKAAPSSATTSSGAGPARLGEGREVPAVRPLRRAELLGAGNRPDALRSGASKEAFTEDRAALLVGEVGPDRLHVLDAPYRGEEAVRFEQVLDGQRIR